MAFQPGDKLVQFADLKSTLSQSKAIDPALYQTVQTLIERLDKFKSSHDSTVDTINNNVNKIVQNIVITPNIVATYLTLLNEVGQLPQSVQLLAGTNITFDDSVSNRRIVNATSGGADLDYLGNYAPATYNDGDIVIGSDGVAYMCVKDGTTTPPEAWPGSSGGSGGSSGPHAPTHEIGGSDIIDVKLLGGFPGGTTTFLRADGTFNAPSGSGGVSAHHTTHEIGGTDIIQNVAWTNLTNIFTKDQVLSGPAVGLTLVDTSQPANLRGFGLYSTGQALTIYPTDDSNISVNGFVQINRSAVLFAPSGLGSTPLNASNLTIGTVPDARLSSNVALRNVTNTFTASQFISTGTNSELRLITTSANVDSRIWRIVSIGYNLYFQAVNDAVTVVQGVIDIDRTGVLNAAAGLGTTPLNASNLTTGTVPDVRLSSNVPLKNQSNIFTANQVIQSSNITFTLIDTSQPVDLRLFRMVNSSQWLYIQAMNDAQSAVSGVVQINRAGSILSSGNYIEYNRTTSIGHWISFTPTFTVDAGIITLNANYNSKYTLIGKTIILSIRVSITLSIAVGNYFMLTPVVGANYTTTPINDSIDIIGAAQSLPTEGRIIIYRNLSGAVSWTAGAHEIGFTISYEFQ